MKPIRFDKLAPGDRFELDGEIWKKLPTDNPALDNIRAVTRPQTRWIAGSLMVQPLQVLTVSFWRRWLLARALRWEVAGFKRWSRWSWWLSRIFATEKTQQALAMHATQLLMMGE